MSQTFVIIKNNIIFLGKSDRHEQLFHVHVIFFEVLSNMSSILGYERLYTIKLLSELLFAVQIVFTISQTQSKHEYDMDNIRGL